MKTSVTRIKTLLQNSATLNTYIKKIEIISPRLLPDLTIAQVPYIGIAPVSSSESWVAQMKQSILRIELYAVNWFQVQEVSIIGDSIKKGILEIVDDVSTVIRGSFLPENSINYLSKPIEITNIDYIVAGYGDNAYLLVSSISLQCVKLFSI